MSPKKTKKKTTKTKALFSLKRLKAFMAKDLKKTTADFKALAKGAGRLLRGPGKFLLWVRTSGSSLALQHLSHQNVLMQDLTPMVFKI